MPFIARSDPVRSASASKLQRAQGCARVRLRSDADGTTRLTDLYQEGCLKVRLPHPERDGDAHALIINTSGGLTGGDVLSVDIALDEGARATITTPACERIYRSIAGEAVLQQRLHVGRGARLDWVPQETILFDQARFRRRIDVRLEPDAEVTLAEAILFGRAAMGETVKSGFISDFWTVRRDERLLFADAVRMSEPFDRCMACPATLGDHIAMASLVHIGSNLEAKRDELRTVLSEVNELVAGVSVIGAVLVARIVAPSGRVLRGGLTLTLGRLRNGRPLPRNWFC